MKSISCKIHWSVSRVEKGTERGAGRESGDHHQAATVTEGAMLRGVV